MMPKQKPGKSYQEYRTPVELLIAVKKRLHIGDFSLDVAASKENSVAFSYYTEEDDGIVQDWETNGWNWCNPPFGDITPWVAKGYSESLKGASTVMLLPASVGSDWWKDYVEQYSYQVFLNGRLCFIPNWRTTVNPSPRNTTGAFYKSQPLYPKDCALVLYTPFGFVGNETWHWRPNESA